MKQLMLILLTLGWALPTTLLAQSPQPVFQVERLDGKSLAGATLKSLSPEAVEVDVEGMPETIPLKELEQLRQAATLPAPELPFLPTVILQNGSQLGGSVTKVVQRTVEVVTKWGPLSFPVNDVRSLRLAAADDKLETAWAEMAARETKNDLLVIRKGDALDFVAGVVGEINEKEVKLLVRERAVAVPRERVFGIVYVAQSPARPPLCEVTLASGDRLRITEAGLAGDNLLASIGAAAKASFPLNEIATFDFTLGKVKALADLPMTQSQFARSPLLTSAAFTVRKNRNSLGKPLRIGTREFPRGLWMHSGTVATFRLGREYRRLTATLGIDSNSTELPRIAPRVKVIISGDGKPLDTREVAWNDPPTPLELDVSGIRELEIRVESAREIPGILEHLVLGEARVIQ
ncbi:NPCBM/NEW2 domain protein [Caulifigura coniformis]|uniref:NPCBM/NEW2 domain protein n=1 Tax=Caulifigura coniformis TaxID=2527983 RepID=A0A517SFJ3_9PLAN|nr:NPCBM/NEW2 domain-containing protein [Caulifigura coniformis]QDT54895.1 NPCBM/NEW2 domain protein [Caulifigura coniformis]